MPGLSRLGELRPINEVSHRTSVHQRRRAHHFRPGLRPRGGRVEHRSTEKNETPTMTRRIHTTSGTLSHRSEMLIWLVRRDDPRVGPQRVARATRGVRDCGAYTHARARGARAGAIGGLRADRARGA